jgi:hypothetical protein
MVTVASSAYCRLTRRREEQQEASEAQSSQGESPCQPLLRGQGAGVENRGGDREAGDGEGHEDGARPAAMRRWLSRNIGASLPDRIGR